MNYGNTRSGKQTTQLCKDVPIDLELAKSIGQLRGLNREELLQPMHQVNLMKDDKR
jgi:hypothetical protein